MRSWKHGMAQDETGAFLEVMMSLVRRIVLPVVILVLSIPITQHALAKDSIKERIGDASAGFNDISLICKVVHANNAELRKISKDFSKSYEIKSTRVSFKAPNKMEIEGKLGVVRVRMVINGDKKAFQVPSLRYSDTENIEDKPHKRQTELDIGILTPSIWKNYIVLDADEETDADHPTYRIRFVRENSQEQDIVCWADAKSCKLLKMEKFEGGSKLKVRYIYSNHKLCNGVWVPGRVEAYNAEGKLAGISVYEDIKVNAGIADSKFKL